MKSLLYLLLAKVYSNCSSKQGSNNGRLTHTEYSGEIHQMAVYLMENSYSIQSPDEFVHCSDLINFLRSYPLKIEIQSISSNKVNVSLLMINDIVCIKEFNGSFNICSL